MNTYRTKLFLLYLLFGAGGLWRALAGAESPLQALAMPMLVGVGLWLVYEYWHLYAVPLLADTQTPSLRRRNFLLWCSVVVVGGLVVGAIGVRTGSVFGQYEYGNTLMPFIGPVPLAAGFVWLSAMLCSLAVVTRSTPRSLRLNPFAGALMTALFTMIFDILLEPTAATLGYWHWLQRGVPMQNYIAWFVVSFVFAYIGFALRIFVGRAPLVALHAYFAQMLYCMLVTVGKV